jgi:ribose transport system permease protein
VVTVIARKNRLGRETMLTGANRATATGSGIGVTGVTIAAFVAAAIGAAIVGIFETAQFSQATTTTFTTLDFDVIAAILVGGTAAGGGEGSALRSALGGLFIALVSNYMLLLGWPQGTITTVEGALVLIAVVTFHLLRQRAER